MASLPRELLPLLIVEGCLPEPSDFSLDQLDIPVQLFHQFPLPGGQVLAQQDVRAELHSCQRVIELMADGDDELLHGFLLLPGDALCLFPLLELLPAPDALHDAKDGLRKLGIGGLIFHDVVNCPDFQPFDCKAEVLVSCQEGDRDIQLGVVDVPGELQPVAFGEIVVEKDEIDNLAASEEFQCGIGVLTPVNGEFLRLVGGEKMLNDSHVPGVVVHKEQRYRLVRLHLSLIYTNWGEDMQLPPNGLCSVDFQGWIGYTNAVRLERTQCARVPTGPPSRSPFRSEYGTMAKKSSILVVDDEDALRTVLSSELLNEGYEVHSAADGDDAITELDKGQYDLVLLDIKMPRMNGFEVLKHIKQNHAKTKVVMLTGFADLKNAIESKKLGADDFVSKPYDLVDLLTTIERVLSE